MSALGTARLMLPFFGQLAKMQIDRGVPTGPGLDYLLLIWPLLGGCFLRSMVFIRMLRASWLAEEVDLRMSMRPLNYSHHRHLHRFPIRGQSGLCFAQNDITCTYFAGYDCGRLLCRAFNPSSPSISLPVCMCAYFSSLLARSGLTPSRGSRKSVAFVWFPKNGLQNRVP